jgi:hypothetical protein
MTTHFRAHFDGKAIIPDEPVDFPSGAMLDVHVKIGNPNKPLKQLADWAMKLEDIDDMPQDLSSQHDHYLYNHPKRP